jgi:hypothetical protein
MLVRLVTLLRVVLVWLRLAWLIGDDTSLSSASDLTSYRPSGLLFRSMLPGDGRLAAGLLTEGVLG